MVKGNFPLNPYLKIDCTGLLVLFSIKYQTLLYEMPSNTKGKNFVSKIYCYCPLHLPSADKYPQILIEVPAEGKCPHVLILSMYLQKLNAKCPQISDEKQSFFA